MGPIPGDPVMAITMRHHKRFSLVVRFGFALAAVGTTWLPAESLAGTGDTSWMVKAKYGIFVHYQYRILLGCSIATKPQFPEPANDGNRVEWSCRWF